MDSARTSTAEITHDADVTIERECKHSGHFTMRHVETRGGSYQTYVSVVCKHCGAKAWFQSPGKQSQESTIQWSWEPAAPKKAATPRVMSSPPETDADRVKASVRGIVKKLGGDGVGTRLAVSFFKQGYVASCKACDDSAQRMNKLGPGGCRQEMDALVEEMLPRAEAWVARAHPLAKKLGSIVGADKAIIRRELRSQIEAAITEYESGVPL